MSEWTLAYEGYDPEEEPLREALCTLGNGLFATRGAAPECRADGEHYPGTYRIGCYNRLTTTLHGTAVENESLVNLPDWLDLAFRVAGGEWFDPGEAELLEYRQELDIRGGLLVRKVRFREGGRTTRFTQRRIVSMADPHIAALETTWEAEDWSGSLRVRAGLDGRVRNEGVERYQALENEHLEPLEARETDDGILFLEVRTNQSKIRIAEAARIRTFRDGETAEAAVEIREEEAYVGRDLRLELEEGVPVTLEKVVALGTSLDHAISECGLEARKRVRRAGDYEALLEEHRLAWHHLWSHSGVQIGPDDHEDTDRTINLYICHTLQTLSENTVGHDVGVPARGLHGEAYRGHVFWDELFVLPMLNFRMPKLTASLLEYRYRRLDEARWAAREAGYEGAMYPWQSGSDGREESQRLHLNPRSGRWIPDETRFQRHVNAAIVYSIWKYFEVSGDLDFLCCHGAEMILEIARFWASIAAYDRAEDRYVITGVVGPDEFHTAYPDAEEPGLANNAYTNIMAVWCLLRGLEVLEVIPGRRRVELRERLGLGPKELERWEDVSRKMKVAFHDDGIISQFEGYAALEELDWEAYREEYDDIQRLDRILEAEGEDPNRYKASKQADVLMLFYLLSADELAGIFERLGYPFSRETIPKNIEYYTGRTSHGSTLSGVVHAWVTARANRERTWEFFKRALESDVSDIQGGTTPEGIHLGAMAGTVDLLQRCYSGLEARGGRLRLAPFLPEDIPELCFAIQYRNAWLEVVIARGRDVTVVADPGSARPVAVAVGEEEREVTPGGRVTFALDRA